MQFDENCVRQVVRLLSQSDFHSAHHGIIFEAVKRLHDRGLEVDAITLSHELGASLETVGGTDYLLHCVTETPSSSGYEGWITVVREWSRLRTMRERAVKFVAGIDRDMSADDAWRDSFQIGAGQEPFGTDVHRIGAIEVSAERYIPCGIPALDATGSGGGIFQPGRLSMVGAMSGHGKTAFLIQVATHLASLGYKPLYATLEQSKEEIKARMVASLSGWNKAPQTLGQQAIYDEATRIVNQSGMVIWDPSERDADRKTVEAFSAVALRMKKQDMLTGAILVDYAQLFSSSQKRENTTRELDSVSAKLFALAIETGLPVIAAAQMIAPKNEPPRIADCSRFKKDSALTLFLSITRPEVDDGERFWPGAIIVDKSRTGFNGRIQVTYNRRFTRFEDPTSPPAELIVDPFA